MSNENITDSATAIANQAQSLANEAARLAIGAGAMVSDAANTQEATVLTGGLTVFVLACVVGY